MKEMALLEVIEISLTITLRSGHDAFLKKLPSHFKNCYLHRMYVGYTIIYRHTSICLTSVTQLGKVVRIVWSFEIKIRNV